ncbi:MAG TPA: hypothetical protein VLA09_02300, partial [Longimicrobiales bacterium]|nr:hypothetical protein [Longimicrobiales bacterium]
MTRPSSLTERVSAALRLDGIRNRIVVLALIATLAPALGNRVLSNRQHRQSVAGNLSRELPSRGSQAAREVDLWVALRSYDVRALTGSVEVSESL